MRFGFRLRIGFLSTLALAACSDSGGSTTSSTTSNLVSAAVESAQNRHEIARACFDTFGTCIASAASDADAIKVCQDTLASCLPERSGITGGTVPDFCSDEPERGAPLPCDGGRPHDEGDRPAPPDGGLPPPPDGRGPAPGGPRGPRVSPEGRIALATCHAQLKVCLDAGGDRATCVEADHLCVHEALVADFEQLCATVAEQCAACADSARCVDLTARCQAGVTFGEAP